MENKELLSAIEEMLDRKLEAFKREVEQRFESLERRLDSLEQRLDSLEQEVKRHGEILESHGKKLDRHEKLLSGLCDRMDRAESRIGALQAGQLDIRRDIRNISEKLDMAFDTAVECWGQCVEAQKRIDLLERKTEHLPEPKAS